LHTRRRVPSPLITSPDTLAALVEPFTAEPARAGVFCDFDGTLAPIVDDPAAARPLEGVADLLAALAEVYARVGVISGRPVAFLVERLGGRGLWLAGLHGLEAATDDGGVTVPDEVAAWRPVVDEVADLAEAQGWPAELVERKGLSVTLHFRVAPEREDEARAWAEAHAARTGLGLLAGRKSYELRPPVGRDKGTALIEGAAGLECVMFAGDDRGDLDAFDALDRLAADGVTTARVGVRSEESPAELLERADVLVEGPAGMASALERLLVVPRRA
jgi:trehalose 6-phosphate phosphatase